MLLTNLFIIDECASELFIVFIVFKLLIPIFLLIGENNLFLLNFELFAFLYFCFIRNSFIYLFLLILLSLSVGYLICLIPILFTPNFTFLFSFLFPLFFFLTIFI